MKYQVRPVLKGEVIDGIAYLDEAEPRIVWAETSIRAALQYRPAGVSFWIIRPLHD